MDVEATIAENLASARRDIDRLKIMHNDVRHSEIQATSKDRAVKITQTLGGDVLKVEIRPGTFQDHDEASFAQLLTKLLQSTRTAARQSAAQLAEEILKEREDKRHG